uniref:UV radiation resistance-associated gene protein n=1 Tax=Riptortus pedestris TaxID=329032 RepID=R4WTS2_RIPPE|nr:hypothetical protein [Riptortus pedestris]
MSGLTPRGILRWKEWIPLVTQQQRLRNLMQVTAYNIQVQESTLEKKKRKKLSYYYTLHLSAMSSPFYTSEHLESEHPKWTELEINREYGSANGVVIRLWAHIPDEDDDDVITVWGVYFSGLVYIGPRLICTDASSLSANSIVLHMHGGYFTAPHCFINPHPVTPRTLSIQLPAVQVKPSYAVKLLLRLQSLQHAIKKESEATSVLREQISMGMFASSNENTNSSRGSATLRKLLSRQGPPKAHPHQILAVKKEIEMIKFKVKVLGEQRDILQTAVQKKLNEKNILLEKNQDKESELMENFCCLRRETEKKRELKTQLNECKSQLMQTTALVGMRRRELISELAYIYPIAQLPDGRYTIRDVHLPNSEDFEGKDEIMISVALGFVAHLVQMISYFLDVPTRYPICHFGSRSKIIDHITDNIPDKEREFPLYSRGKEKHSFNYGVYLLNKNIAQLRWYCGLTTSDLRHTLPNLQALMNLNKKDDIKRRLEIGKNKKRTGLSCSLDQGLNNVALQGVNSDPQHYTTSERRQRCETAPPIHDLASLMLLDIPNQGSSSYGSDGILTYDHKSSESIDEVRVPPTQGDGSGKEEETVIKSGKTSEENLSNCDSLVDLKENSLNCQTRESNDINISDFMKDNT